MCVKIGPDVIINNAFYAVGTGVPYLDIITLKQFSQIVYKIITTSDDNHGKYKYVYFEVSESDVEEYIRSTNRFIKGFGNIYAQEPINKIDVEKINSAYSLDVQEMLQQARAKFATMYQQAKRAYAIM